MPGAWEQVTIAKMEVLVVILTREIVTTRWAQSFRNIILPPSSGIVFLTGMPYAHARNTGVLKTLEVNADYLFFIDDDVEVPPDTYSILKSHNKDIVSGTYYRRSPPITPVWLNKSKNGPSFEYQTQIDGKLHPADLLGGGCLLLKTSMLRQIPSPWFEWKVDRADLQPHERFSEDFSFCQKAKALGFQPYIDTSVLCNHIGLGCSNGDGTYTPALI